VLVPGEVVRQSLPATPPAVESIVSVTNFAVAFMALFHIAVFQTRGVLAIRLQPGANRSAVPAAHAQRIEFSFADYRLRICSILARWDARRYMKTPCATTVGSKVTRARSRWVSVFSVEIQVDV
jgi:hypothetical protein